MLIALGSALGLLALGFFVAVKFRRVVSTNDVHIVQSAGHTTSYGKDTGNGNVYYEWPSWLPKLGVTKIVLPVSNFDLKLNDYEAYDSGRLPFVVDVMAFFRVSDSNIAAQRISSKEELIKQLTSIVQGAIRSILASSDIEEIMQGRSKFGEEFTKEVTPQLSNWGVTAVKNIELMDIRDHANSKVIANIMQKKSSQIEAESRTAVAENKRKAALAETEAEREINLGKQAAAESVGLRTAQVEREVGLAKQDSMQVVTEREKVTKEKQMAVLEVETIRKAQIVAEAARKSSIINAEAELTKTKLDAESTMLRSTAEANAKKLANEANANAILTEGNARAESEKQLQLASVEAQVKLATEIGSNAAYQEYLLKNRQIEANQAVGIEQAKALSEADIKIVANTGDATSGLNSAMDILSSRGGTAVGAMLDGLANTETGQKLLSKAGVLSNGNGAGHS